MMMLMATKGTEASEETEVGRARRSWPATYKLEILEEIEEAKRGGEPGAVGAILRREGLYSSLVSEWRKQRDKGALEGLRGARKGRPAKDRTKAENAALREQVAELEERVSTLSQLVEAQGKVSALLQQMSRKSAEPTPAPRSTKR